MIEDDSFDADLNSGIASYDAKNFAMAYQLLAPLAKQDNVEALWRIAMMRMYGLGMVSDQELGVKTFIKAHELGSGMASHMLGVAYMNGEGTTKDLDKAISYFEVATTRGMQGAAFSLAMIYSDILKDNNQAAEWENIAKEMDN